MNLYKHYNQAQLNDQYNTRLHVPDYAIYFDRWEKLSRQTAEHHTLLKDIPFGEHAKERLDIFPSKINNSKTLVFIHGGYWLLLVTGTEETDEFKDQSEELYHCWKSRCSSIELLKIPQKNHYSILDAVIEKDSTLRAAMSRLMNIDPETASG
jgi:hypothetical protein